tara:strand:+ start:631 stop:888 length:258 start_codon:yes stop_codon:yes gene_type:complete
MVLNIYLLFNELLNDIKYQICGGEFMKLTAYSVKLKKVVDIAQPKIVTMKNGRKAVSGVAAEDPSSKVFRILSDKDVAEVEKMIG